MTEQQTIESQRQAILGLQQSIDARDAQIVTLQEALRLTAVALSGEYFATARKDARGAPVPAMPAAPSEHEPMTDAEIEAMIFPPKAMLKREDWDPATKKPRAAVPVDHMQGFALHLSREEWGAVVDGLIAERNISDGRKAANSESTSDIRADTCAAIMRKINSAAATAAPPVSAPSEAVTLPVELVGVREQIEQNAGFWHSCSGCHETEDGHPVGSYAYSNEMRCALGSGCSECGGLGAVWDNNDYEAMARELDNPEPSEAVSVRDAALLDWLNEQTVDTIYLDDGRLIDVRGGDVRAAIRAVQGKPEAQAGEMGPT